jgi:hypothetical protein
MMLIYMRDNKWARLLAYVTGLVNQRLLIEYEYPITENRILRSHLPSRCACPIPSARLLRRLASRSAAKTFGWSPQSRSRMPSWPSTAG